MFTPRYIYCDLEHLPVALPRIAELGLGVELLFESTEDLWPQVRWENLLMITDSITAAGLEASVHGPFHGLNLGTQDAHIRDYSCEVLAAALEMARAVRSPHLVFHTGFIPQYSPKTRARWLDNFSRSLEFLLVRADDLEVRLAMENTYETTPELFEEIFDRFSTPALGMCFDCSHATCYGRVEAVQWAQKFADRICHLHLSDNDGRDDIHLGLGQGVVNFRALLAPLVRAECVASATFEVAEEDAAASRDFFDALIKSMTTG